MNKVLFIVSHLGSDSHILCNVLNAHFRIQWYKTDLLYDYPMQIQVLTSYEHKAPTSSAIWMEELLYNHHFSHKQVYKMARFIYLVRDAKPTLSSIIEKKEECQAKYKYYIFRLRRIYEMARKTKENSLFLTWNELTRGFERIEEFLEVDNLNFKKEDFKIPEENPLIPSEVMASAKDYYDKFYSWMTSF